MTRTPRRATVLARLADHLAAAPSRHPVRVAVDGITAAGKTTFAGELAAAVAARGRPVVRLSTNDFHHAAAHRHRNPDRAVGYYRDAFDLDGFRRLVLDPLGPGGDRRYRPRSRDLDSDRPVDDDLVAADADAVVIVDGTFLQAEPLHYAWDETVWLAVGADVALDRALGRDRARFGGDDATRAAYAERYHAAGRLYVAEHAPQARATVVVDNDDLAAPSLLRIGGPAGSTASLFSYGTLQQPGVQLATFGRELGGEPDSLPGHRADWVQITDPDVLAASRSDRHPIVRPSSDPSATVAGAVITVTTEELAGADHYEVADYRRVRVTLASGRAAWVYLAADPPG